LFSYGTDYRRVLWDIVRALAEAECLVHALALMANHLHLILVPPHLDAMAKFVKSFAQSYAAYRNKKRRGSGKLFEERYISIPIRTEAQLAITTAYIELNPVRAGVVDHPADFKWSTYRLHAGDPTGSRVHPVILTPSGWYLGLSRDPAKRAQLYCEFVESIRARDAKPDGIEEIEAKEREAQAPYTRRLHRPDGTRAREATPRYGSRKLHVSR